MSSRRAEIVQRVLDALERAIHEHVPTDAHVELLWPCPSCSAAASEQCANARAPGRSHAPRVDRMTRATQPDIVQWARRDLQAGVAPHEVFAKLRKHMLVRRLVELGHASLRGDA